MTVPIYALTQAELFTDDQLGYKYALDEYDGGPLKKFRTKKEVWEALLRSRSGAYEVSPLDGDWGGVREFIPF